MSFNIADDMNTVLVTIERMKDLETAVSEFYLACSKIWQNSMEFWHNLSQEELVHASYLTSMLNIILSRPEHFKKGRPFNLIAVNTTISGIGENTKKVKGRLIDERMAVIIARDIEQSLMESKYAEIVNTEDIDYISLVMQITTDTGRHLSMINERLKNL